MYIFIWICIYIYIHTTYTTSILPPRGFPFRNSPWVWWFHPSQEWATWICIWSTPPLGRFLDATAHAASNLPGIILDCEPRAHTHTHDEKHNDAEVDRIWILKDIPVSMRIFRHFHILSTPGWLYVYVCTYRCVYTAEVCIDTHTHIHTDFMYIYIYIDSYISFHFPHYMWQCVDLCIYCIYYNSKIM